MMPSTAMAVSTASATTSRRSPDPNGIVVNLAAGAVTGQDAAATAVVGSDTLRSIESVRASNANDIYNATGFTGPTVPTSWNPSVNNGGDQGNFNEFEGMAGNDQVTGNGNTRIVHYSALAGIVVTVSGFTNLLNPGAGVSGSVTGDASIGTDSFTGVSQIRGSIFNDTFTGFDNSHTGFVEQFDGWAGNDSSTAAAGSTAPATTAMTARLRDAGHRWHIVRHGCRRRERPECLGDVQLRDRTLLSVEMIRGTNLHDIYDATGFSGSSANTGSQGTFNEFEGGGGNDQVTGNGNTRISFANAAGGVIVNLLPARSRRRVGRQRHHRRGRQSGPRQQLRRQHHRHGRCRHPRRSRQHRHAQRRCRQRSSSWGRRKRHHQWRRRFRHRGVFRPSRRIHRDARSQPRPVDSHRQRRRS